MKILVKTAQNGELFGKRLSLRTMVELFVSPDGIMNEEEERKAIQKIKSKYAECGFAEEANNVMSASLCVINETVNHGDVSNCSKSKNKSKSKSKSKNKSKSYMASTVSSRLKGRGQKTRKQKRRIQKSI
jgi:P pilus assembly chaperone PapD